jgi:RNA polymerase sigma factor (sigma-70 family)
VPLTPELARKLGRLFVGGAAAWDAFKEGPTETSREQALNRIVTDNEPFIRKIVESMFARGLLSPLSSSIELSVDDLMQAGRIAYCKALSKFDPTKGALPPYAKKWVVNEVARTAANSSTIHKPANVGIKGSILRKAEAIETQYGRPATPEEMGVTSFQYDQWKREATVTPLELEFGGGPSDANHSKGPLDWVAIDAPGPEDLTTFRELDALVHELPEPCRSVVYCLYWDDMTLDYTAKHLGISTERVKGFRTVALGHLRAFMDQDPGPL